jgi:hypothetical protein
MPGFTHQAKNRREFAPERRLVSKFEEFADEFAAIRAAEFAETLHQGATAQPRIAELKRQVAVAISG